MARSKDDLIAATRELFKEVFSHTGREIPDEFDNKISDWATAVVDTVSEEFAVVRRGSDW